MESQKLKLYKFALKYGLILAAIPTIYNIVLVIMGLHLDYNYYGEGLGESYTKARLYLLPIILFIAIYSYRKLNAGHLKLIEAIKIGLWILLIGSIIVIGYNLIFRLLIVPDFSNQFYEINREQIFNILLEGHLELGRDYTQADMDSHIYTNGSLLIGLSVNIVLNLVFTLFFSLIIGLIMKKKIAKDN